MAIAFHALVLVAVLASVHCGDRRIEPDANMTAADDTIRLTAATPRQSVRVPARAAQDTEILRFSVTNVTNPDQRAITINAAVQVDETRVVTIGDVALFPVDSGGTFSLRVPEAARALMARTQRAEIQLVFTLARDPEAPQPDQRAVSVTGWHWVHSD